MISTIISRLVILLFGTLYPAYASYKAVKTKNVREYVKWMMYWIVFALFTCAETFTDVFFSWFPFYYEIKIVLVLWLLSPATKGSSILYRKFVHPMLSKREQEIDDYIAKAKDQGYHTVLNLGTKGVNYATTVIMQTAIKGGGGLVNQLKKSYSLSDLTDSAHSTHESRVDSLEPSPATPSARRRRSPQRSASGGSGRVDMYFPEVDIRPGPALAHVRSTEDVSSGYSSAEPLYVGQPPKLEAREGVGLVRTASVGGVRPRTRATRAVAGKKAAVAEDSETESEAEFESARLKNIQESIDSSESSDSDFLDSIAFPSEIKSISDYTDTKIVENVAKSESEIFCDAKNVSVTEEAPKDETKNVSVTEEVPKDETKNVSVTEEEPKDETKNVSVTEEAPKDESVNTNQTIPAEDTKNIENTKMTKPNIEDATTEVADEPETPAVDPKQDTMVAEESICVADNENPQINADIVSPVDISELNAKQDLDTISLVSLSQRGGKYHKHSAPSPPSESENPITATLVLKPGIIKSLSPQSDEMPTQIFVSHSPKAKRKKYESPITKLMMLPRKLWGSKEPVIKDAKSTDDISRDRASGASKSDSEYCETHDLISRDRKSVSASGIDQIEDKIIVRKLSHSPKRFKGDLDDSD